MSRKRDVNKNIRCIKKCEKCLITCYCDEYINHIHVNDDQSTQPLIDNIESLMQNNLSGFIYDNHIFSNQLKYIEPKNLLSKYANNFIYLNPAIVISHYKNILNNSVKLDIYHKGIKSKCPFMTLYLIAWMDNTLEALSIGISNNFLLKEIDKLSGRPSKIMNQYIFKITIIDTSNIRFAKNITLKPYQCCQYLSHMTINFNKSSAILNNIFEKSVLIPVSPSTLLNLKIFGENYLYNVDNVTLENDKEGLNETNYSNKQYKKITDSLLKIDDVNILKSIRIPHNDLLDAISSTDDLPMGKIGDSTQFILHYPQEDSRIFEKFRQLMNVLIPQIPSFHQEENIPICQNDYACMEANGYLKPIREAITPLLNASTRSSFPQNYNFPRCVLLYGPSGVGKTSLVNCLAHDLKSKLNYHYIDFEKMDSYSIPDDDDGSVNYRSKLKTFLNKVIDCSHTRRPSLVFIDHIDSMLTAQANSHSLDDKKAMMPLLISFLDDVHKYNCMVIAATNQMESLDLTLRRPGRFEYEIEISAPNNKERFEILKSLLKGDSSWKDIICDSEITNIANITHGFTGADLKCLVNRACLEKMNQCNEYDGDKKESIYITHRDIIRTLKYVKPSAMKEINLDIPEVQWSDIGGMARVKQELIKAIEWPLKYPEAMQRMGLNPSTGILLHGPPGCSKTMIAKALATQSGLNFFSVKGPELFSKYVGDSEKMLRKIFSKAKTVSPSIIFFDEIDAIAVERSNDKNSHVGDRVLTQLLTEMDGIEKMENVFVLAATNRIDKIDKALLRPGRLGKIIYVPLPDLSSRKEILRIKFDKMPIDTNEVCLDDIALKTDGYSGAEVVALCQEAALHAMEENPNVQHINMYHFTKAFNDMKPLNKPDFSQNFEAEIRSPFQNLSI